MDTPASIRTGHSCAPDSVTAVREFQAQVQQANPSLVLFFCSSEYDLDALAQEMRGAFPHTPVLGCTTAGEIGPAGYCQHTLSGISFPADSFTVVTGQIDRLQQFDAEACFLSIQALRQELNARRSPDQNERFALQLIDGLCGREEEVTQVVQQALGGIPLTGGSAGDDLRFSRTWVYHDGAFHDDSAVLALVATACPVRVFKTQHFTSQEERVVVTDADPARRTVREINGLPAAEEYARMIDVPEAELTPKRFATAPVVVVIDGTDYVRAIQKKNDDGSLTFYCAIEDGLVLRVARGNDLVGDLEAKLRGLEQDIGPPQLIVACDCILRNLEITEHGEKERVGDILRRHRAVGFSTYGEQCGSVHVNQTLTGIAIGNLRNPLHD